MLRALLKSKIHGATVTETELFYEGSITLSPELVEAADMMAGERVDVVNMSNGARLTTYVIIGEPNSNIVCLNGPAARLGEVGDQVHILNYGYFEPDEAVELEPTIVHTDAENNPV